MKVSEIKKANPEGKMTKVSGNYGIQFENGVFFNFKNSKEQQKVWRKLIKMGFAIYYNFSSDEHNGIIDAYNKGENPFAFTIMCGDSKRNIKIN